MKKINHLGINLTKEVQDLYSENYKILQNETKEDLINGKTSHVHELKELILLRWQYHQRQSRNTMQSLSKSQWFFCKNVKLFTKFIWNARDHKAKES